MKRMIDFLLSFIGLIILAPVFMLLGILVKFKIGSPIFFRQQRPGLNSTPFYLYKFRSMTNEKDSKGRLLPDEKRLTSFGSFLRKYSLDELPQLLNVLKGDLSLVGPRPLLMEYLSLYTEEQAKRHIVRPGLTGWAQINGRNSIELEEKLALDVWYVNNRTLLLDLKILLLTVVKVIRSEGVKPNNDSGSLQKERVKNG